MWSKRYVLSTLLISAFSSSCAHQNSAKNVTKVPEPDKVDSDVPQELWSPERKKSNASFYYLAGEHELMAHNAESAAKLFDTAYTLEPNAFVAAKLVEAKSILNVDDGLQLAKKMSLLYPKNPEIQLTFGRLLAAKGDLKGAEGYLKRAVKLRPENLESSVLLIQLLQAQNRTKEAIEVTKQMVERNGDFVEGWALLSRLYLANNQPAQAVVAARKAYDLNTTDPEKMHLLAVSLLLAKQTKESLTYFDQLLRPENFSDDTIEKMVKFYDDLGMPKHYTETFQKAEKEYGKKSDGLSF